MKIENGIDYEENICAKTSAVMSFSTQTHAKKLLLGKSCLGSVLITQQKKDKIVLYAADNVQRCF